MKGVFILFFKISGKRTEVLIPSIYIYMYIYIYCIFYIYIYIYTSVGPVAIQRQRAVDPIVQWIRSSRGSGQPKVGISGSGRPGDLGSQRSG